MTDESWGVSVAEQRRGGRDAAYLLGAGLGLYAIWVTSTVLGRDRRRPLLPGRELGSGLPHHGLLRRPARRLLARAAAMPLPWLVAGGIAVAAKWWLPGTWYIILGAVAGSLVGAWRDSR